MDKGRKGHFTLAGVRCKKLDFLTFLPVALPHKRAARPHLLLCISRSIYRGLSKEEGWIYIREMAARHP